MQHEKGACEQVDPAIQLARAFAEFGPAYMKWIQSQIHTGDITYPRMRLLMTLNEKGPQIMSSLSEELSVTPRNITVLVDALEQDNLVQRKAHPNDRRAIYIELTYEGQALASRLYMEHFTAVSKVFTGLSMQDQHELLRLLGLLHQAFEHEGIFTESLSALRMKCDNR